MAKGAPVSPTPIDLTDAKKTPDVVEVPSRHVLSIDGEGSPSDAEFAASIGALYGIAYGLKFDRKRSGGHDFKVGALVGVWRAAAREDSVPGTVPPRDSWSWTLQIDMPTDVTIEEVQKAVDAAVTKKGGKLEGSPHARRLALVTESPCRCCRMLHIGPYSEEPRSFQVMQAFLDSSGLRREPWHVEVYLSDPGRTAPEKLKTVLLVPVSV